MNFLIMLTVKTSYIILYRIVKNELTMMICIKVVICVMTGISEIESCYLILHDDYFVLLRLQQYVLHNVVEKALLSCAYSYSIR
jgi:hypothetical protein